MSDSEVVGCSVRHFTRATTGVKPRGRAQHISRRAMGPALRCSLRGYHVTFERPMDNKTESKYTVAGNSSNGYSVLIHRVDTVGPRHVPGVRVSVGMAPSLRMRLLASLAPKFCPQRATPHSRLPNLVDGKIGHAADHKTPRSRYRGGGPQRRNASRT